VPVVAVVIVRVPVVAVVFVRVVVSVAVVFVRVVVSVAVFVRVVVSVAVFVRVVVSVAVVVIVGSAKAVLCFIYELQDSLTASNSLHEHTYLPRKSTYCMCNVNSINDVAEKKRLRQLIILKKGRQMIREVREHAYYEEVRTENG
jgi:hypothetical protein